MCALFCEFVPTATCDIVLRSHIYYSFPHVIHRYILFILANLCLHVIFNFAKLCSQLFGSKIRWGSCPKNSLPSNFLLCKIILQLKSDLSKHKKPAIITVTSRICFFGYPQSKFVFRKSRTRIIRVNHARSV